MHSFHSFQVQVLAKKPSSGSMGNKEELDQKERREKKSSKNHGRVFITVYVESSSADHKHHRKSNSDKPNRQKHCSSRPPLSTRYGSDRKAHLLSYAQQLRRSSHSKEIGWMDTNLRPERKSKWSWGSSRAKSKFHLRFKRIFNRVRTQEGYAPFLSDHKERSESNAPRDCPNHFCRRLRSMLKELSCGWKCNKG